MKLSIVVIGDELLIGQVTDTNSGEIARAMGPDGWETVSVRVIGDNAAQIKEAINNALSEADLVITTGGLGPTKDDITKAVMLEIFGGKLIHNPDVAENIREVFNRRGLTLNPLTLGQAMVPDSCRVIQNRFGTAPVMWFEQDGKVLVAMPGVPFETVGTLPEVRRLVNEYFSPGDVFIHRTFMVAGITESDLASHLDEFESALPSGIHLAYLPQPGLIRLRLDGVNVDRNTFENFDFRLKKELGDLLIFYGDATPAEILLIAARSCNLKIAAAESCTGGNIAHLITSVPGSSDTFLGGIVSYANEVKQNLLGIKPEDLETHGAVSREVVEQMAIGVCRATGADCSVATSGIAGPGGGSPDKPVGTVWMAWCVNGKVISKKFRFPGDRLRVINRASTEGILGLHRLLCSF